MIPELIYGGLDFVLVLLLALAIDRLIGEPPNALHPVAWIGRLIALVSGVRTVSGEAMEVAPPREAAVWQVPKGGQRSAAPFLRGLATIVVVVVVSLAASLAVIWLSQELPRPFDLLLLAYALKLAISPAALASNAKAVGRLLEEPEGIGAARQRLSGLVSRNTAHLDEKGVSSAAISSVSENFNDAVVAPLTYALIFGLPGAWVFRAVNTADSMIGYRGRTEWTGKASARLDDALGYLPARMSAILLCAAAPFAWLNWLRALRVMISDAHIPPSPNSGWPMAAAAGALGVKLDKPGQYIIGSRLSPPDPRAIRQSVRLMWAGTALLTVLVALVALGVSASPEAGVFDQAPGVSWLIEGGLHG